MIKSIDTDAGSRLQDLINDNLSLRYKYGPFEQACKDLGQITESEKWSEKLNSGSTAEDVANAVPEDIREHFFKLYVAHSGQKLRV